MLRTIFTTVALSLAILPVYGKEADKEQSSRDTKMEEEKTPQYLYKVLSAADWHASQNVSSISLSPADRECIHFSREDQLDRILTKYWADAPEFVILKINVAKLPGKLVFEANPGGTSKYYHLYNGSIPKDAIVESKVVNQELH